MSKYKTFPTRPYGGISSLEGVEVGDEFVIAVHRFRQDRAVVKCEKVTATRATIGGRRYTIKDARGYGESQWNHHPSLDNCTDAIKAEIKEQEKFNNRVHHLNDVNWKTLPADVVAKVYALVIESNKKVEEKSKS